MIKVNVHYFEDANVQLNNVKEITIKMDVGQVSSFDFMVFVRCSFFTHPLTTNSL